MYRMAIMGFISGHTGLDPSKLIKLAIVHDIAESLVGDITPHDGISNETKFELEQKAIQKLQSQLGEDTPPAQELSQLWHEYEEATTQEALLVKDFDKLEMILQASEYEAS